MLPSIGAVDSYIFDVSALLLVINLGLNKTYDSCRAHKLSLQQHCCCTYHLIFAFIDYYNYKVGVTMRGKHPVELSFEVLLCNLADNTKLGKNFHLTSRIIVSFQSSVLKIGICLF